jgi:hypothetical protein
MWLISGSSAVQVIDAYCVLCRVKGLRNSQAIVTKPKKLKAFYYVTLHATFSAIKILPFNSPGPIMFLSTLSL